MTAERLRHALLEFADRRATSLLAYADTAVEEPTPATEEPADLPTHWEGVIGIEGELTGDGRLIGEGALEWTTPLPLRFVMEDVGGHEGAVTVGRILEIERGEGGALRARGDFDLGSDVGREAARLVGNGVMTGVSMDLDSVAFEVRVASEVVAAEEAVESGEEPEPETAEDGSVIVHRTSPNDEVMFTTSGRIRGATLVSIPAFASASIAPAEPFVLDEALVASAAPIEPPQAWFFREEADGPTALTITDEGQVYGHLATWDTCHIGDPAGGGACVMAPKNNSGYAYFHTGAVKTAEGTLVPTGTIRFKTGHANLRMQADAAAAHYDNTGLAGADIHVIDGKHGIWVAGALRPGLTPEQVRELRAAPLSGDWRAIDGAFELVGALAVNLPGFPIPRTSGLVASGSTANGLTSLVAAGMLPPANPLADGTFSSEDLAYLQRLVTREKTREQRELAARVRAARTRAKVAGLASRRLAAAAFEKVAR